MPDTFIWSNLFETGIAEIDQQHRHLVDLINYLARDAENATPEHIGASLQALTEYTVLHFQAEEHLMAAGHVAAGHADHHRDTHQRFIRQVSEWLERHGDHQGIDLQQLLEFLSNWLVFHILGDDQSLGRQLAAIRAGIDPQAAFERDHVSDDPRTEVLLDSLRHLYAGLASRNEELIAAQQELAGMNATLEQRIAERTAALIEANRHLEEEREKALKAEKMASLGRMVAGFAHEINTPVGIAVGAVSQNDELLDRIEGLLESEEVSEEALRSELAELRRCGALALSNLRRAANLVHSFKRTSIDQTSELVREFSMKELIDDVLFSLHGTMRHARIATEVLCPDDLYLLATPGLLGQVLTNLLMNAYQHAFAEGSHPGTIRIEVSAREDLVHLTFADDGAGMSDEQLSMAFEPFYTTRRGLGGSGLGLYICYSILTDQLGGTLVCSSRLGAGCRFDMRFPARVQRALCA
jgi:hemerythrin-like metal-binding protein